MVLSDLWSNGGGEHFRPKPGSKTSAFARLITGRRPRKAIETIPGWFAPGRKAIRYLAKYLGSRVKMSQSGALQKARKLKAEALGT